MLYHGSNQSALTMFTEEKVGRGGDVNSALGVWVTADIHEAAQYAGFPDRMGQILQVEADIDYYTVLRGRDEAYCRGLTKQEVASVRDQWMADGLDACVVEGPPEFGQAMVVLDPDDITIVDRIESIESDRLEGWTENDLLNQGMNEPDIMDHLSDATSFPGTPSGYETFREKLESTIECNPGGPSP